MISLGRTCRSCGTEEVRWRVENHERTNLNPITGECVDCTARRSRAEAAPDTFAERHHRLLSDDQPETFDAKAAAAGRDDA